MKQRQINGISKKSKIKITPQMKRLAAISKILSSTTNKRRIINKVRSIDRIVMNKIVNVKEFMGKIKLQTISKQSKFLIVKKIDCLDPILINGKNLIFLLFLFKVWIKIYFLKIVNHHYLSLTTKASESEPSKTTFNI